MRSSYWICNARVGVNHINCYIFWWGAVTFIGLLGIYIGKIFLETKKRPNYIIREKSN